jgi:hypothetical protein
MSPEPSSSLGGAPGRTRTSDARFRKPTLYPLSYEGGDGAKPGAKSAAVPNRGPIVPGADRATGAGGPGGTDRTGVVASVPFMALQSPGAALRFQAARTR